MNETETAAGCGFLAEPELEALLRGRLPAERRAAFESHAASGCDACALLLADADCWREAGEDPPASVRREFLAGRDRLERAVLETNRGGHGVGRRRLLALAGLVAAAGTVTVGLWLAPGRPEARIVLPGGAVIRPAPPPLLPPPVLRGETGAEESWARIRADYDAGRFGRAAAALARLERSQPDRPEVPFYRGVALLLMGDAGGARASLARARSLSQARELPVGSIDYYDGLAALALGELEAGTEALARARDAGGPHAEAAAELLDLLAGIEAQPPEGSTS